MDCIIAFLIGFWVIIFLLGFSLLIHKKPEVFWLILRLSTIVIVGILIGKMFLTI